MARATGLQVTETWVRIVEVEGTADKFRVVGQASQPIEADAEGARTPEALTAAVKACFKAAKAGRERVILGLSSSRAVIREIQIPFTSAEQIRKVIKFEFESHLPTGGIDDYIVDFHKVSESGPRSRVLAFAIPKAGLRETLQAIARAGVEPAQVDLDAPALFGAAQPPEAATAEATTNELLLDVDETSTTMVVCSATNLRLVRSLRLGAESLGRQLAADLATDGASAKVEAREALAPSAAFGTAGQAGSSLELKADIVSDRRQEFTRRLISEVRRSLTSVQLEGRLASIRVAGELSSSPELLCEFERQFEVPVQALDVFARSENRIAPEAARASATALGLALKGVEHDPLRLDFRREEFQFAHRFDRVRVPLSIAAGLALVCLGFLCILQWNRITKLDTEISYLAEQGRHYYYEALVRKAKDPRLVEIMDLGSAEQAQKTLDGILTAPAKEQLSRMLSQSGKSAAHMTKTYGVHFGEKEAADSPENVARSAVLRLEQFVQVLDACREKTGKLIVERLQVGSLKLDWNMRVESLDAVEALREGFSKLEGFRSFSAGQLKQEDGMHTYTQNTLEFEGEN